MSLFHPSDRIPRSAPLLVVLISLAFVVAAYLQALHYPFVSDDDSYVVENTRLSGLHLAESWRLFIEPYNPFEFLPLRDLSYWFDITLFGLNPAAFRIHNIILYLLCVPLVYVTTRNLWCHFRSADIRNAPWAAAAVTALFALHPAHVEAVVWVSGRKDVLSGLFSLLALWLAVKAKHDHGLSPRYASAALIALMAAMLSKATAVGVAPVAAMLWLVFLYEVPATERHRSQFRWPIAALLLAAFIMLIFSAKSVPRVKAPLYFGSEVITRALAILGWSARLAVSPESRHFFYPVLDVTYLPVMVAGGSLVLVVAVYAAIGVMRKRSLAGFALLVFLLLCVPYTQLISYRTTSLVSDRFLFLAAWPASLLVVIFAWSLKKVPRTVLLLVIATSWGFQAVVRTTDWRSFETIIDADLRGFPGYFMPVMFKIGNVQLKQGLFREATDTARTIADTRFRNAMDMIVQAVYVVRVKTPETGNPEEAMALLWELGLDLRQAPAEAKWNQPANVFWTRIQNTFGSEWRALIEQFPGDASVHYSYGLWKLEVRHYMDAATHLRAAAESRNLPESMRGTAYKGLGLALLNSGHAAEAEAPSRAALEQTPPDFQAYCVLAEVYERIDRIHDAELAAAQCSEPAAEDAAGRR